jgi:hypothetical protein
MGGGHHIEEHQPLTHACSKAQRTRPNRPFPQQQTNKHCIPSRTGRFLPNPAREETCRIQYIVIPTMPQPRILICLPTYSEEVHINFAFSLMNATRAINDAGATFETLHVASSHIIRARNFFANYFLNRPEFTPLLFLDTTCSSPGSRHQAPEGGPTNSRCRLSL